MQLRHEHLNPHRKVMFFDLNGLDQITVRYERRREALHHWF